jgi:hypothetical protein
VTFSWRESASQQSQDDLDGLVGTVLPFAQQMLAQHGGFYPFAAVVSTDGQTQLLAADLGQDHPDTTELRSTLVESIRDFRDGLRAAAVCSDVRLQGADAIRVELEHRDGQAMAVLMPYQARPPAPGIEYQDLRAVAAEQYVWT